MNIFDYQNYKDYLKSYITRQPNNGWGLLSRWAEILSVKSSFLGQVLNGNKNLQPEQAFLLGRALILSDLEMKALVCMVNKERAGHHELRSFYDDQLHELRQKSRLLKEHVRENQNLNAEAQSTYYSHWLYSAIRLYTTIAPGKTQREIALRFEISENTAKTILNFLCQHQICRNEKGYYFGQETRLMVHKGDGNYFKHLTNWRLQAVQKSGLFRDDDLFITSPMSMAIEDFALIRAEILSYIKEISKKVESSTAEEVYCFNLDFFKC